MKKIGKTIWLVLSIVLLSSFHFLEAQELLFIAKSNKYKVGKYEEFEITFSINAQGIGFKEPKNLREHFTVISGPNSSTYTSISNAGLRIEQSYTFILMPKKMGKFTISEASINVGGKTIFSKPFDIEVVPQVYDESIDPNDPKTIAKKLAFVKIKLPKNNFYVGEVFTVDYLLYYRTGIGNIELLNVPDFKGFYSEILREQVNPYQETVDGELFNVVVLKRMLVFGQKSGTFSPGSLEVRIPTEIQTNSRDLFNPFFRSSTVVNQVSVSQCPTITIKELPTYTYKTPFSGAVGKFRFKANLTKSTANAGDAVSLKLTIEGSGNLKLIQIPEVEFPVQFDVYEPKKTDKISVTSAGMVGSREIEYILIPKYNGEYTLQPLYFTYFDPSQNKYVEQVLDRLTLKVTGGEQYVQISEDQRNIIAQDKESGYLQRDILFIKQNSNWIKHVQSSYFVQVFKWWTLGVSVAIAFALLLVLGKQIYGSDIYRKIYFKKQIHQAFIEAEKNYTEPKDRLNLLNQRLQMILSNYTLNNSYNRAKKSDDSVSEIANQFKSFNKKIEESIFSGSTNDELTDLYQDIKMYFSKKLKITI